MKSGEEQLRKTEQELVHKLFRRPREGPFPTSDQSDILPSIDDYFREGRINEEAVHGRQKRLFSLTEEMGGEGGEMGVAGLDQSARSATLSPSHKRRRTQSMGTRPSADKRIRSDCYPRGFPLGRQQARASARAPHHRRGRMELSREEKGVWPQKKTTGLPLANPEEISVEETAVGGGGGQEEEESGFIFPSSYVENDITISVEYGTIKLQTEER